MREEEGVRPELAVVKDLTLHDGQVGVRMWVGMGIYSGVWNGMGICGSIYMEM